MRNFFGLLFAFPDAHSLCCDLIWGKKYKTSIIFYLCLYYNFFFLLSVVCLLCQASFIMFCQTSVCMFPSGLSKQFQWDKIHATGFWLSVISQHSLSSDHLSKKNVYRVKYCKIFSILVPRIIPHRRSQGMRDKQGNSLESNKILNILYL